MKTLILGASGLVGGNCHSLFRDSGWECMGTHFSFPTDSTEFYNTLDAADPNNADVNGFAPEVVIHCGALTWVDYCEENPDESHLKTVQSTKAAIEIAQKHKAKFVYLSTDYVFDGKTGFYVESDQVNPLSVYGKHKLEAERLVEDSCDNFLICRITNVYGDEIRGKNFIARLVKEMKAGKEIDLKLPIDQYATPVNAADVARAIKRLLDAGSRGIYHFASTDYLNRVQLAERVNRYFGHEQVQIRPVTTEEINPPAERPLFGGMNAAKFAGWASSCVSPLPHYPSNDS